MPAMAVVDGGCSRGQQRGRGRAPGTGRALRAAPAAPAYFVWVRRDRVNLPRRPTAGSEAAPNQEKCAAPGRGPLTQIPREIGAVPVAASVNTPVLQGRISPLFPRLVQRVGDQNRLCLRAPGAATSSAARAKQKQPEEPQRPLAQGRAAERHQPLLPVPRQELLSPHPSSSQPSRSHCLP